MPHSRFGRHYRTRRSGAIAVLAAFGLVFFVAFLALTIDLGFMLTVRSEMQCAADAGALAGAGDLSAGHAIAIATARDYVLKNAGHGVRKPDLDIDVEVGHWHRDSHTFVVNEQPLDAVRVNTRRQNAPLFFGQVLRNTSFDMQASAVASLQPRDIMLVLDYSGSMNDQNKIGALKDAVSMFLAMLQHSRANDRVGLAVYSTTGELAQSLTFDLSSVDAEVRSRPADGWTAMGSGMELGRRELTANARPNSKKLMVLMTDGMANRPLDRDPRQYVRDEAQLAADAGFPIVAISFSNESDRTIMQQVADITSGVHFHVAGSASQQEKELKRVFREVAARRPLALVD